MLQPILPLTLLLLLVADRLTGEWSWLALLMRAVPPAVLHSIIHFRFRHHWQWEQPRMK